MEFLAAYTLNVSEFVFLQHNTIDLLKVIMIVIKTELKPYDEKNDNRAGYSQAKTKHIDHRVNPVLPQVPQRNLYNNF